MTEVEELLRSEELARWWEVQAGIYAPKRPPEREDITQSILRTLLDQPSWLDFSLLYDEKGSALFDRISRLPEYYLTRTEEEILRRHAAEILSRSGARCLVELGAGFSTKTTLLLEVLQAREEEAWFVPIDVSQSALVHSRDRLKRAFPGIRFVGLLGRYEEALGLLRRELPALYLFLGSSLGNFTPRQMADFFSRLRSRVGPKSHVLLGVDCLKEEEIIERAYNDSEGVTAEFILNALDNVNRLTGSNFDVGQLRYLGQYNSVWRQVEMYACFASDQQIYFPSADVTVQWRTGERIRVEISRKFDPHRLSLYLERFGFVTERAFSDSRGWFTDLLLGPQGQP